MEVPPLAVYIHVSCTDKETTCEVCTHHLVALASVMCCLFLRKYVFTQNTMTQKWLGNFLFKKQPNVVAWNHTTQRKLSPQVKIKISRKLMIHFRKKWPEKTILNNEKWAVWTGSRWPRGVSPAENGAVAIKCWSIKTVKTAFPTRKSINGGVQCQFQRGFVLLIGNPVLSHLGNWDFCKGHAAQLVLLQNQTACKSPAAFLGFSTCNLSRMVLEF